MSTSVTVCTFCIFKSIVRCESTRFHLMYKEKRTFICFCQIYLETAALISFFYRVKDRGGLQASGKGIFVFSVLLMKTSVNSSQLVTNLGGFD